MTLADYSLWYDSKLVLIIIFFHFSENKTIKIIMVWQFFFLDMENKICRALQLYSTLL